jgi:hypothetical protein
MILVAVLAGACTSGGMAASSAPTLGAAATSSATASAVPALTPLPTAAPTPAPTAAATATPAPTPRATAAPTPPPSPSATPPRTATPSPTPSATPEPSATPAATRTLRPGETPAPTPVDLAPFLTSELVVVNLGNAQLSVAVAILDPESTDEYEVGVLDVEPLQVTAQSVFAARYRLEFDYPGGAPNEGGTCVIDVGEREEIQFAVLEDGGVIPAGSGAEDPGELAIEAAARCRAGAGA